VTRARSVEPLSAFATTYVFPDAPIAWQLVPPALQRSQSFEKSTRYLLCQVPWSAVRVWPTAACPVTVGSPVFVGPTPWPVIFPVAFDVFVPILFQLPSNAFT